MTVDHVSHHVGQGDLLIAKGEATVIAAVLGSCVAACLWDPFERLGGMNHILLPHDATCSNAATDAAESAMHILVEELLQRGAERQRIRAKVFGGARMIETSNDIGRQNANAVLAFLDAQSIECVASSLGGDRGRKIRFWPATGRVRQQFLPHQSPDASSVDLNTGLWSANSA